MNGFLLTSVLLGLLASVRGVPSISVTFKKDHGTSNVVKVGDPLMLRCQLQYTETVPRAYFQVFKKKQDTTTVSLVYGPSEDFQYGNFTFEFKELSHLKTWNMTFEIASVTTSDAADYICGIRDPDGESFLNNSGEIVVVGSGMGSVEQQSGGVEIKPGYFLYDDPALLQCDFKMHDVEQEAIVLFDGEDVTNIFRMTSEGKVTWEGDTVGKQSKVRALSRSVEKYSPQKNGTFVCQVKDKLNNEVVASKTINLVIPESIVTVAPPTAVCTGPEKLIEDQVDVVFTCTVSNVYADQVQSFSFEYKDIDGKEKKLTEAGTYLERSITVNHPEYTLKFLRVTKEVIASPEFEFKLSTKNAGNAFRTVTYKGVADSTGGAAEMVVSVILMFLTSALIRL